MSPEKPPTRGLAFWLATFFGSGLLPKAPGTWGTVASLVIWAPLVLLEVPWWARLGLAILIFAMGVPISTKVAIDLGKDDPKEVVIDEVAGQGVALSLCGPTVGAIVLGFLLFRVFDIAKPFPVGWADRKLHGGMGIMLDDMLAGGWALLLLYLFERFVSPTLAPHLGGLL